MKPERENADLCVVPKPEKVIPLEPDEFVTAFAWGMNAALGSAKVRDPSKGGIRLIEPNGDITELEFANNPLTRFFMAMSERYGEVSYQKYFSASWRTLALGELIDSGKLAGRVSEVPDQPYERQIAPSVFEAAATLPLKRGYKFSVREFIRKVREIEAREET